jgi:hypothetical protein
VSFADYVESGWALCRIRPGTKAPAGDNWQYRESAVRDPVTANGLMAAGLCHAWSGTCAVDIDNWDVANEYLKANGVDLESLFDAEDAVQLTSGRQGRGKLIYALPNPLPSVHLAPYKAPGKKNPEKLETYHGLELRCATRGGLTVQDVLPPTIHPDTGRPYSWVYGDPVMGHWSNPPPLPAALRALWTAQREPVAEAAPEQRTARGATVNEIQALLDAKDPEDFAYDDWLETGLILHHELGGSAQGYAMWLAWSSRCSKHDVTQMPAKWRSFGQSPGPYKTIGSWLQERVAAPEEFAINEAPVRDPDEPEDTGPTREIDAILRPRIVYLLDQQRYYHKPLPKGKKGFLPGLDEVGAQALRGEAFDVFYTPYMPIREVTVTAKDGSKRTQTVVEDPRKCVKQSRRIEKVNGIGFHPGASRIFLEEDGNRMYNEYSLTPVEPLRPKPHELDAWAFLCSRIEDDKFRSWLLRFFAHMIAKPGVKIQSAPLLVSDTQGTGKTTWMQTIPQILLGEKWVNEISSEQLAKSFNSYLARTWWVTIEELKTDGPRMDRIAIANKMKPWITSKTIPVEFKGLDVYKIYNRVQIGASSNFRDTMQLDNSDRRWGVGHVVEHAMTEAEKAGLFKDFLDTPRAPGVVRWLIQQENLTGFSPTALPPSTLEKRSMISFGYGPWETKIAESMVDGGTPFDRDVFALEDVQLVLRSMNADLSRKRVATLLTRPPFNATRKSTGTKILYCWRNQSFWDAQTCSEWETHRETAVRPSGALSASVPVAIKGAAGDDESPEEDSVSDLLGAI